MDPISVWIAIDRSRGTSLAQQLVEQLRDRILRGTLTPGAPLPSSRALALELGVSRSVVVRAYEQLNGEGYLESEPGSTTRIASGIVPAHRFGRTTPESTTGTHPSGPRTPPSRRPAAPIDLRTGSPFAPVSVPPDWRRAMQAAAREPLRSEAPPALGDPRLRTQIALHAQRSRGINCAAEDVIVTSGTVDALLLISLALGQGKHWGMEDPGYTEAAQVLRLSGARIRPIPVSSHGLRMQDLRGLGGRPEPNDRTPLDALLVTPSHQFPLGGRMSASERTAIVAWAAGSGVLIVEDDYDSEFRHVGTALPAIASLDPGGTVAHVGSLNKSFSPSLRCGYVITTAGSAIWKALSEAKQIVGSNAPAVVQTATAAFFESGAFRRYVARTRREYRHRRELLIDVFADAGLADHLLATEGGLHAILRLPQGVTGAALAASLAHSDVLVDPISEFAQLDRKDDAIAVGYGAEPVTRLLRGLGTVIRAVSAQNAT